MQVNNDTINKGPQVSNSGPRGLLSDMFYRFLSSDTPETNDLAPAELSRWVIWVRPVGGRKHPKMCRRVVLKDRSLTPVKWANAGYTTFNAGELVKGASGAPPSFEWWPFISHLQQARIQNTFCEYHEHIELFFTFNYSLELNLLLSKPLLCDPVECSIRSAWDILFLVLKHIFKTVL